MKRIKDKALLFPIMMALAGLFFLAGRGGMADEKNKTDHSCINPAYEHNSSAAYFGYLPFPGNMIHSLAIDPKMPSTLYGASVKDSPSKGVYKSMDGGATWTPIIQGLPLDCSFELYIDPQATSVLYACGSCGLFKTSNGGASWEKLVGGSWFNNIAFDPFMPGTIYAGKSDGIYKSADGGVNWQCILQKSGGVDLQVWPDPHHPNTLFIHYSYYDVHESSLHIWNKSTDNGATWTWLGSMKGCWPVAFDPLQPDVLYAFVVGTFCKSSDGGMNWSVVCNLTNVTKYGCISDMVADPSGPNRIFLSDMCMDEWASPHPEHANGRGIFQSIDGGKSWELVFEVKGCGKLIIEPITGNHIYGIRRYGLFVGTMGTNNIGSDKVPTPPIALSIYAQKFVKKAWIVRRSFAKIDVTVQNPGKVPGITFAVIRGMENTNTQACIKNFTEADMKNGSFTLNDPLPAKNQNYYYFVEATDAAGVVLATSNVAWIKN